MKITQEVRCQKQINAKAEMQRLEERQDPEKQITLSQNPKGTNQRSILLNPCGQVPSSAGVLLIGTVSPDHLLKSNPSFKLSFKIPVCRL